MPKEFKRLQAKARLAPKQLADDEHADIVRCLCGLGDGVGEIVSQQNVL